MKREAYYIGGTWRMSDLVRPVINPYDGTTVNEVCQASAGEIDEAIAAAAAAFPVMRQLSSRERVELLAAASRDVRAKREELARRITSETGKPINFSRVEADRAAFTLQIASEEASRIEGSMLPLDLVPGSEGRVAIVRRFPIGPVAAITPFNFPLNLVAHKLGPAFAAGNPVVLKPSSNAPGAALDLARIFESAGLPKGALNVVPCLSGEATQLIEDERIKMISFTGSPAVGWPLKARAGKKKVTLELGGNAAVVVDETADVELALRRTVAGAFGNAGQSCIAVQRVFVHETLLDGFLGQLAKLAKIVATGDPTDDRTVVGPMITVQAAAQVEEWIQSAVAAGGRLLCGGKRRDAILEPTVLVDAPADHPICAQEVFAPVVVVEGFSSFEKVLDRVNDSRFGLQAGVFSNSLRHVLMAYTRLEVGGIIVNDSSAYRVDHMPYGGIKDSGFGREGLRYAIEEMTEQKLLALNPN
jgi:acyl-CoA reductase-like NAD-dependent aldehyde dehydrogenase